MLSCANSVSDFGRTSRRWIVAGLMASGSDGSVSDT